MYLKPVFRVAALVGFCWACLPTAQAQVSLYEHTLKDRGVLMGGMGIGVIDGDPHFIMNLRPELAFGKFGVGLDINLRYNTETGELRNEDWDQGYDFLRAIRYARYGYKRNPEPLYTRLGALDAARLGHGFVMNYYNNSLIYDQRKVGLELDYDFGIGGFESMTNNLGRSEIFGGRVYYRPLQLATNLPILRNFAIGATYVTDIDPDNYRATDDGVTIFGFDAELPIIKTDLASLALYADLAKIVDHGKGQAAGVDFHLSGIAGLFEIGAQLERRFLDPEFIPAYFGPFYELERDDAANNKEAQLHALQKETRGTYGMLYGHVLNTMRLVGTYERLDGIPKSGRLHIEAAIPDAVPKIAARGMYDDRAIDTFSDVFKMDENSATRLGLGYKIYPFLIFYMDYLWTFRLDEATQTYKVQRRFEPQLALSFTFPVGGNK